MNWKKVSVYSIVCVIAAIALFIIVNVFVNNHCEAVYTVPRHIQYSFTLRNKTNRILKDAQFWTYAPVKQTPTQRCEKIETSHPYELIADESGNQVLHFSFSTFPPFATKIITISADLLLAQDPNRLAIRDEASYLSSSEYIESQDPEIIKKATELKTPASMESVRNIFHWVADNVENTGYAGNRRGALYALTRKKGDCTESADLFIALCRANNIPSRLLGGYVCMENAVLKPSSYHNWAEFYEDGTWRVADPSSKSFMQDQSHYIAMQIIQDVPDNNAAGFNRFRYSGDGLQVKMN